MRVGTDMPSWAGAAACQACLAVFLALCVPVSAKQSPQPARSAQELIDVIASPTSSHEQRWKAVQTLKSCGSAATPGLLRILSRGDTKGAKYYAIRALGYLKDTHATQGLSAVLLDRGYAPRRYAAIALGQIRDPKAVPALTEALTDLPHVRADALDALAKIDSSASRKALEKYYFSGSEPGLKLQVSCEPSSVVVGGRFVIKAALANASKRTVRVVVADGEPTAYLVLQRADGGFVEMVDTGVREDREEKGPSVRELKPGATLDWRFVGAVQKWTRGEKDDNTFIPSGKPFLTLSFDAAAFHIRRPGDFSIRVVLRQDEKSKTITRSRLGGESTGPLNVVSNAAALTVGPLYSP